MRKHLNTKNVIIAIIGAIVCTIVAVVVGLFKSGDDE